MNKRLNLKKHFLYFVEKISNVQKLLAIDDLQLSAAYNKCGITSIA
jgi:hypothetical protein